MGAKIGLKALDIMERDHYAEKSQRLGSYLMQSLKDLKSPLIREIRGSGLWVGIEIDPLLTNARILAEDLMAEGVLTKETQDTVLRLAPPLIITKEQIDGGVAIIAEVLRRHQNL